MCRLLGYVGASIQLDRLLYKPKHSLIVQSYQPQEMTSGVVNADGFGIGWHDRSDETDLPYTYKNVLPIWSDLNLPQIARYVKTECFLGYIRSATPGSPVDLLNCQPFTHQNLLFIHNGFIENFRETLYRPIRNLLNDEAYKFVKGSTDSEHILALMIHHLQAQPDFSVEKVLQKVLIQLVEMANKYQTELSANLMLTDGDRLIASRFSNRQKSPSLYWVRDDLNYPDSVIVASEPMFEGNWNNCPENSIITVEKNLEVCINPVSETSYIFNTEA